ncbi:response regulator transcription factor [Tessaracoccus sp. HDW20]|nr:response regulator transcription factor [Tessaracoccus coleopterorum]
MTRILIIEDEESYRDATSFMLAKEGFEVLTAADGLEGLSLYDKQGADLVLLDLMMPGMPGVEVCRQLRARGNVAIVMVTARDSEVDKVVGLELGADDYVTKPFSHRELVARIRAVLRRGQDQVLLPDVIEVSGVRLDVERHQVNVDGEDVRLALREFELLELLLRNAGRVMTRGQLIDRIWGSNYVGDTKTLDVHIKRLRAKVEKDPANPNGWSPSGSGIQVRGLIRGSQPRAVVQALAKSGCSDDITGTSSLTFCPVEKLTVTLARRPSSRPGSEKAVVVPSR